MSNLTPVSVLAALRLTVQSRDRGLKRVEAGSSVAERGLRERDTFMDLVAIPKASILLLERNGLSVRTNTGIPS